MREKKRMEMAEVPRKRRLRIRYRLVLMVLGFEMEVREETVTYNIKTPNTVAALPKWHLVSVPKAKSVQLAWL